MSKKEVETVEVVCKDFYGDDCLVDSMQDREKKSERRPKGIVEIYDVDKNGQKKLIRKNNLVLYQGRETLAQMLVRVNTVDEIGQPPLTPMAGNKDHFLCWFGIGSGAASTECYPGTGDVFAPEPPTNEDIELKCPEMISNSDPTYADYHIKNEAGYPGICRSVYPETGHYKKPFSTVSFEQDTLNDNKWIVIRIGVNITSQDGNGTDPKGQAINEAGLYTADSNYGGHDGPFALFARVTFPTLLKDDTRRLMFAWYLFL